MMELFDRSLANPPPLHLSGSKVWLRPPQIDDWAEWATLRSESRDFLEPWEPTWPADCLTKSAWQRRLRRQYEDWRRDAGYAILVFRNSDMAMVGGLSLTNVRRGVTQTGTLGYWCGKKFAHQGYISEAVMLLREHAFGALALHRIEAGCLPRNIASRNLLTKCGFREEGYAQGYLRINGKWEDHVLFGLTRDDEALRP